MITTPKILIVDDDPRMCESMKSLLSIEDYDITTTCSGKEALSLISENEYDVALMDIILPDIGGLKLMEQLNKRTHNTLVINITGSSNLDSAIGALRRGAYDYLRKPFEHDELLKTVQNALNQKILELEKKAVKGQLDQAELRYFYLVHNSPDIIYILDNNGIFTFISDAAQRLLKLNNEALIGKHYSTILHEKDQEKAQWHFNERRTGSRATSGIELRLKIAKNGGSATVFDERCIHIELKATGMYDKTFQKHIGTHGVARDISDRKILQDQFHQSQKMEAVGTLAGGIAHDFNNILMGIQGQASLMLLHTDPSHKHYKHIKKIEHFIQSASDLTQQLLGYAKGGKYNIRTSDLNQIIETSAKMFWRTKKEIKVFTKYQKDIWPVEVDRGQIEQVLLNLYINAWQAMMSGGSLYIESENATINDKFAKLYKNTPGEYVKLSVKDTGIGMDKKIQERIFDPFFTTKEMGRGTGLGLASAYGIIQNHNGIINVDSKKDSGTTFNIYLPASDKAIISELESPKHLSKGTETILLVDDEDIITDAVAELLEQIGYKVFWARSGREALSIYKSNKDKIHLVILDIIMPDILGGETFDRLREINPEIKVLLSSGYSLDGQATEIMDRGCNSFIQKPFNIKELSVKIREVLDAKDI
ncbi:MAG: response regulator [Deltaproteobacteria bacterium]|nr:response regulator [Deltaproteobacteria bacterium]